MSRVTLHLEDISDAGQACGFTKDDDITVELSNEEGHGSFARFYTFQSTNNGEKRTFGIKKFLAEVELDGNNNHNGATTEELNENKKTAKGEFEALRRAYSYTHGVHSPTPYAWGTATEIKRQRDPRTGRTIEKQIVSCAIIEEYVGLRVVDENSPFGIYKLKDYLDYLEGREITSKYQKALIIGRSIAYACSNIKVREQGSWYVYPNRDIKDDNLRFRINHEANEVTCILLDWGQAHRENMGQLTATQQGGRLISTACIAAPEMLNSHPRNELAEDELAARQSPSVDSWSIAAIMFQIATGSYPYEEEINNLYNAHNIHDNVAPAVFLDKLMDIKNAVEMPVDKNDKFSAPLAQIIKRATHMVPAPKGQPEDPNHNKPGTDRRTTVSELYNEIAKALDEEKDYNSTLNSYPMRETPSPASASSVFPQSGECIHSFGKASIDFAPDGKSAQEKRVCKTCGYTEIEECEVTLIDKKDPTCTEPGYNLYQAKGSIGSAAYSVDLPAFDHVFGPAEIDFAADGKSATAYRRCERCQHVMIAECTILSGVAKQPTCTEPGETKYTAKGLGAVASKTIADIPALGHLYTEPKIEFAADGKSATASKTCKDCGHKVSEECTVTSMIIKLPTEAEPGEHIYHAKGLGAEASKTIADISFCSPDTQGFFALANTSRRPPEFFYSLSDAELITYLLIIKEIKDAPEKIAANLSDDELQAWSCSTNMSHNFPVEVTTDQIDKLRQDFLKSLRESKALMEDELKRRKKNSAKEEAKPETKASTAKNTTESHVEQAKSKEKAVVAKTDASPKAAKIKKKVSDMSLWPLTAIVAAFFLVVYIANGIIVGPETYVETLEGINRCIGTDARITQEIENIATVQVGETVEFGVYEQDNRGFNGKEPISWRVLAVENGEALLISEKGLDFKQLNDSEDKGNSYETSDLRTWLRGDFVNKAFSSEKEQNLLSTLPFCLSLDDAETYLSADESLVCYPTEYANARSGFDYLHSDSDTGGACWWWLSTEVPQSIGSGTLPAAIPPNGDIRYHAVTSCTDTCTAVRPAIWVNVEAEQA